MTERRLVLERATPDDAPALSRLHTAAARALTEIHGKGPWSAKTSVKGVLLAHRTSQLFVVREDDATVAVLRLTRKKPWAIDLAYFPAAASPLYLLGMAVHPARQRQGIGRWAVEEACRVARAQRADALRLDAYDAAAGAGEFYLRCGFTEVGRATYRRTPLRYFVRNVAPA